MVAPGAVLDAVLDTNILIDYLRGVPQAREELARYTHTGISIITWMDVMAGAAPALATETSAFLSTFVQRPLTANIAEVAVRLRRELRMKLPDAIILATAEVEDCILVTRNTRDFLSDHPRIRVPYQL